jgi:hypothetical protein
MARLLADRDSTDLHLNLARRHQRLARRYKQTNFVDIIQLAIDELVARQSAAAARDLDRHAAYDNVIAADADLDDGIRNLFGAAEAYDRENPGACMVSRLFPEGGFGDLISQPVAEEPASAEALASKVETLGVQVLTPYAAKLRTLAQAVRDALHVLNDAVRASKSADAEEEIAQGTLRRQYEHNYLNSRQAIGRTLAERLFPKTHHAQSSGTGPSPVPVSAQ